MTRLVLTLGLGLVLLAGCATPHIGTTASSFMRRAREDGDPNIRHLAYSKLADPNCFDNDEQRIEAVKQLSEAIKKGKEPVVTRAVICRTLGEIGRPEARDALLICVDDPEPVVRAAACRSLGKVGNSDDAITMARVMSADSDPDVRIAAIEGIKSIKEPEPRVLTVLAQALTNPDPAIRLSAYESLQAATGEQLPPDPEQWRQIAERAGGGVPSAPSAQPFPAPPDQEPSRNEGPRSIAEAIGLPPRG